MYKVTKSLLEGFHDGAVISLNEPDDDDEYLETYSGEAYDGDYTKEETAPKGCPNPADTIQDLKNLEHYRKKLLKES